MQNNKQHVPNGWALKRFDEFAPLQRGFDLPIANLIAGDVPVIGSNGAIGWHNESKVNSPGIVTGRSGTIGKVVFIEQNYWPHNTSLWVTSFKGNSPKYVYYFLNFMNLSRFDAGSGVPTLNRNDVHSQKINIPPVEEQNKIAEILTHWDEVLGLMDKKIGLKKQQKKYLMQQLLTGTTRLPGFNKPWDTVKLGDIANLYQPQTISQDQLKNTGYPVFGANGFIGYYDNYNHKNWQIMITCRGSTCGTVNRTYAESWITGNAMVINCDEYDIDKIFLYYLLLNNNFSSIISGSGQPQIVRTPLNKWGLSIPGIQSEQTAIANVLTATDDEIKLLGRQRELINQQKKYLMQNLLTGQIRVKIDTKGGNNE